MIAKPDIDPLLTWCRQEVAVGRQQLQRLEKGELITHERSPSGDTTEQTIQECRAKIETLERLLEAREGA